MALSRESCTSIKDVTFSNEGALYTDVFSSSTIEQMVSECHKSGVNETGGILIASYSKDSSTAMIVEAMTRQTDSLTGRTTFQRGVRGLRLFFIPDGKRDCFMLVSGIFIPEAHPSQVVMASGP